jgi:hypothetical protein
VPYRNWSDAARVLLPDFKNESETLVEQVYAKVLHLIDREVDVREHARAEQVRIRPTPQREDCVSE